MACYRDSFTFTHRIGGWSGPGLLWTFWKSEMLLTPAGNKDEIIFKSRN
jgi:hypothetical protein